MIDTDVTRTEVELPYIAHIIPVGYNFKDIMSRVFIESFFPAIVTKLRTMHEALLHYKYIDNIRYNLFSVLCPSEDATLTVNMKLCHSEISVTMSMHHSLDDNYYDELHVPTSTITIRNPVLFLFAIFGAIFGLYISLLHETFGLLVVLQRPQRNRTRQVLCWSMTFLFFGLMNVAAIPLHCLFPMKNDTSDGIVFHRIPLPQQYPLLWMMDTFCTGVFSTLLIAALHNSCTVTNDDFVTPSSLWSRCQYMVFIVSCGCTAACRFLINDSSIELELWYIVPVLLAAILFAREMISSQSHHLLLNQHRILLYYYRVALVWVFCGIFVDPLSCRWMIQLYNSQHQSSPVNLPWWWDFTRLPAIAFGACDLVFVGLYHHLMRCVAGTSTTSSIAKGGEA